MVDQRAAGAQDVDVDLAMLVAGLTRDWRRILLVVLIVGASAFLLTLVATPHYKGEARLLIEPRESVFTRHQNSRESEQTMLEPEGVASQVEVLTSSDLIKQVITRLDLADLDELRSSDGSSLLSRLLAGFGLKDHSSELSPEERVIGAFRSKLTVYRVDQSRVIVIEFSSRDPQLAALIPNTMAQVYIALLRQAKLQSNEDATQWLEPEIEDLREQVKQAEAQVASYRAEFDLPVGLNDNVLSSQQLSELASELSRVRADRAESEARAQSLSAALADGTQLETLPDVLSSALIQRLRERQVQLRSQIAELSTTLLENHPRIKALRSQLSDLSAQIRVEAQKILQGLQTEVSTARFRERQLTGDLNMLKVESARAGEEGVELRALEREAVAKRDLLESYLARYREALSRREGNYLPVDARVFSSATLPSSPYFPKPVPIVTAALAAALLVMVLLTLLRELFSGRAMRPAGQPTVRPASELPMPVSRWDEPDDTVAPTRLSVELAAERIVAGGVTRALFISPEGDQAAAAAVMVAREVADAGLRTILVDLTATGAASRPMLDGAMAAGITDLLASQAQFAAVIHGDRYSTCHLIPAGMADPVRAMRAADRLPIIMEALSSAYDVVMVECGPAEAAQIGRLMTAGTQVMVSVLEPDNAAIGQTAQDLVAGGYDDVLMVTPLGLGPSGAPWPDRSAA